MKTAQETRVLRGWDDEKIYFRDEKKRKEWCVSDEEALYRQLVELCSAYFEKKASQGRSVT